MNEIVLPPAFVTNPPRRVVFVCVHNSARSQMAEGLARSMAPPDVEVWSAGTEPRGLHPRAIEVMAEVGLDIAGQRSKLLDEVPWRDADTIVTLCGEGKDVCPAISPIVRRVHWPLPDPAAAAEDDSLQAFRDVRDEIRWRVSSLWPAGD